jgi:transposase-like protein
MHKIANVLDAVPKSIQPKVKAALHDVMNAEHKEAADLAVDRFVETYGPANSAAFRERSRRRPPRRCARRRFAWPRRR